MDFFYQLIDQLYQQHHQNDEAVADFLGIKRPTVRKWRVERSMPSLENAAIVISKVGGDLSRALPTYNPEQDVEARRANEQNALQQRVEHLESAINDARRALDRADQHIALMVAEDPPDYSAKVKPVKI
jgi:DNA-binding XRE family transcriptional regulator